MPKKLPASPKAMSGATAKKTTQASAAKVKPKTKAGPAGTAVVKVKTKAEVHAPHEIPISAHLGSKKPKPQEAKLPKVDLDTPPWEASGDPIPVEVQEVPKPKGPTLADVAARQSRLNSPINQPTSSVPTGRPLTMKDVFDKYR